MSEDKKIQVGNYLITTAHNKITKGELEFRLEPKIMQVLVFLIENRQRVVSREDISESLWPGSVVGLDVITRAIFELRKLFEDDAKSPRFIETIPRKGYCFIHEVNDVSGGTSIVQSNRIGSLLSLLLLAGFALILLIVWQINSLDTKETYKQSIVPYSGGMVGNKIAIDETGQHLVVAIRDDLEQRNQLHSIGLKNFNQEQFASEARSAFSPIWLAKTKKWAYVDCDRSGCKVYSKSQGEVEGSILFETSMPIREISSHIKSNHIVIISALAQGSRLSIMDSKSNNISFEKNLPTFNIQRAALSESDKAYFTVRDLNGALSLYLFNWKADSYRLISDQFGAIRGLVEHDNELLLSGKYQSEEAIWRINPESLTVAKVFPANAGEFLFSPSASSRGDIVYYSLKRDTKIANKGLDVGTLFSGADSDDVEVKGVYAKQKQALLFVSNRTGTYEIWLSSQEGLEKLTDIKAELISQPQLSPNESRLAFVVKVGAEYQTMMLDVANKKLVTLSSESVSSDVEGWLNPDQVLVRKRNKKETAIDWESINVVTLDVEHVDSGTQRFVRDISNTQRHYFLNEEGLLLSLGTESYGFDNTDLSALLDYQRVEQAVINGNKLLLSIRGENKQLLEIDLQTKHSKRLLTLPNNGYVSDIGMDKVPYVIFDQLQTDKARLILQKPIRE